MIQHNANPYVRLSSMMMPPSAAVAANMNVHVNPHMLGMGGLNVQNASVPAAPPLTSLLRNVTPEQIFMAASLQRASSLVTGYHRHPAAIGTESTLASLQRRFSHGENIHRHQQQKRQAALSHQQARNSLMDPSNMSLARMSMDPSINSNICRDSLTDHDGSSESEDEEDTFASPSMLPPRLSSRSVTAPLACPTSLRKSKSLSLNTSSIGNINASKISTKISQHRLPSRKRNFDSFQTELRRAKSTSAISHPPLPICRGITTSNSRASIMNANPAKGGNVGNVKVNYKSKTAGAASWNSAVRKDINKAHKSSSPCDEVTEYLCDVCKVKSFPTHVQALAHEAQCHKVRRKFPSTKSVRIHNNFDSEVDSTAAVPTSLSRAVTDDNGRGLRVFQKEALKPTTLSRSITVDGCEFVSPPALTRRITSELRRRDLMKDDEHSVCIPVAEEFDKTTPKRLVLATKEDKHWLSDLVCLIRENIEVFAANPDDVAARSRRGGIKKPIAVGRVGIRCIHCANVPHQKKAKGAVSYPNSIRIVHQAVRNWQRYHFDACEHIPDSVRKAYSALKSTRSHSGNASLKYWIDSTTSLGLVDTNAEDGIRFAEGKGPKPSLTIGNSSESGPEVTNLERNSSLSESIPEVPKTYLCSTVSEIDRPIDDVTYSQPSLVCPSDKNEITDFLYELLNQQQACQYKAVDRNGKRKYRELGFPGVECKHCARNAGAGRYFPLMVTTLANNNNPFNCTHSHMMKCRRCPKEVKNKLAQLQLMHAEQGARLPSGWKKKFFDKLWVRLHGPNSPDGTIEKVTINVAAVALEEDDPQTLEKDHSRDNNGTKDEFDNDIDSAAHALSSFSAQAFSDAAKHGQGQVEC